MYEVPERRAYPIEEEPKGTGLFCSVCDHEFIEGEVFLTNDEAFLCEKCVHELPLEDIIAFAGAEKEDAIAHYGFKEKEAML